MEKKCPICFSKFIDESWDERHDYCSKCERKWDQEQRKTYRKEKKKGQVAQRQSVWLKPKRS